MEIIIYVHHATYKMDYYINKKNVSSSKQNIEKSSTAVKLFIFRVRLHYIRSEFTPSRKKNEIKTTISNT